MSDGTKFSRIRRRRIKHARTDELILAEANMLSLQTQGVQLCDRLSRREALRIGGLGACGLSLPQLLASRPALADTVTPRMVKKARSCVVLFLMGGPPQQSTWDPKPDAPKEVRGEIEPIATKIPGVEFGELMPRLAQHADKLAVLRAVSTNDNAHSSSGYYMLTGRPHTPMNAENANPGPPNDWPNWGSVVQRLSPPRGHLPASVRLPNHIFNTDGSTWPGQDGGMLGRGQDPWLFRCQPHAPDYHISEFQLPENMSLDRLSGRRDLVRLFDQQAEASERLERSRPFNEQQQRAYGLLASAASRGAFDLSAEDEKTRQRYGASPFGRSCLLARRLVEEGARYIEVTTEYGPFLQWDTHDNGHTRLAKLKSEIDAPIAQLVIDLEQRGLLDRTLIVLASEFSRDCLLEGKPEKPVGNQVDQPAVLKELKHYGMHRHFTGASSVLMFGGGTKRGFLYGKTADERPCTTIENPINVTDLHATMLHTLGIAPDYHVTVEERPFYVTQDGRGQVHASLLQ